MCLDWTALGTWGLVIVTGWFLWRQNKISREQLKIRLQLQMEDRFFFDPHMIAARRKLAEQILCHAPHSKVQESIMNFFDTMGVFLREKYLNEELISESFSWYGTRWWTACKDYIEEENKRPGGPFFEDFKNLVDTFKKREKEEPSPEDIETFLDEEKDLE